MTTPVRRPGRTGRLPQIPGRPRLQLGPLLTGAALPVVPPAVEHLRRFAGTWKMLGNGPDPENAASGVPPDGAGDCVSVSWATARRIVTAWLTGAEVYPGLPMVVEFYKTQNPRFPAQDDGMVIQLALEELVRNGGPDGVKAVAFAQVDHTNPAEVQAAIAIFGYLWVGIEVEQANEEEFSVGLPWDSTGSPVVGLHSVIAAGYGAEAQPAPAALGGPEKFETWAEETSFTAKFWADHVEEAWVAIWPEHKTNAGFLAGVDTAMLAQAYQQITGRPLVWPDGPPPPPPPPAGVVWAENLPADQQLGAVVMEPGGASGKPWALRAHTGQNKDVAAAVRAWYQAHTGQPMGEVDPE